MTKSESNQIKGIAITFMLLLHLFNTYDYQHIYDPYLLVNVTPLTFYISLFADCCVVLFLFCSGYGLYFSYKKESNGKLYFKSFPRRLKNLYLRYWIIIILFCFLIGPSLGETNYPGDFLTIILNLTALDTSYNGAWWFFTTYVICLLLSPFLFSFIDKYNVILVVSVFSVFYTLGYLQRFKEYLEVNDPTLEWGLTEIVLLGNSLLPFMLGAFFFKFNVIGKLKKLLESKMSGFTRNISLYFILIAIFIAKTYVPTLFTAIFTGVAFLTCYLLIDKPLILRKILTYLGMHSTNIWLTHMFIYFSFDSFSQYVYLTRDPIIIFSSLLIMCLGCSYVINFLERKIQKIGFN